MDNSDTAIGFLRLSRILAPLGPFPVSKSTWWAGVKAGKYPAAHKISRGCTAWRVADIRAMIDKQAA